MLTFDRASILNQNPHRQVNCPDDADLVVLLQDLERHLGLQHLLGRVRGVDRSHREVAADWNQDQVGLVVLADPLHVAEPIW